jgi:hypothetical protein
MDGMLLFTGIDINFIEYYTYPDNKTGDLLEYLRLGDYNITKE